jgi:hypothetical protein
MTLQDVAGSTSAQTGDDQRSEAGQKMPPALGTVHPTLWLTSTDVRGGVLVLISDGPFRGVRLTVKVPGGEGAIGRWARTIVGPGYRNSARTRDARVHDSGVALPLWLDAETRPVALRHEGTYVGVFAGWIDAAVPWQVPSCPAGSAPDEAYVLHRRFGALQLMSDRENDLVPFAIEYLSHQIRPAGRPTGGRWTTHLLADRSAVRWWQALGVAPALLKSLDAAGDAPGVDAHFAKIHHSLRETRRPLRITVGPDGWANNPEVIGDVGVMH